MIGEEGLPTVAYYTTFSKLLGSFLLTDLVTLHIIAILHTIHCHVKEARCKASYSNAVNSDDHIYAMIT